MSLRRVRDPRRWPTGDGLLCLTRLVDETRGVSTPAAAPGYFDAASTEPLHPAAREVLLTAVDEGWADPARLYGSARRARILLDNAREIVAAVIGSRPDEVTFTTSGTQAVQLGVLGAFGARERAGTAIVVSAVEHSSVLQSASYLRSRGATVRSVDVDRTGLVDVDELDRKSVV